MMRWILMGLGVLLALSGCVWFLQGIGVLPSSVMSRQPFWAVAGVVTALVGVGLVWLGYRRKRSS